MMISGKLSKNDAQYKLAKEAKKKLLKQEMIVHHT